MSKPLKNNLNKEIVVKKSLQVNNLGSVVPKSKKGPVLAKRVKSQVSTSLLFITP